MADTPDPNLPWTEARWEAEFRRMDLRADRFGELLETLIDDPDRHDKIAREMGWHGRGVWADDGDVELEVGADEPPAEWDDDDAEERADRRDVPAYAAAMGLAGRVMDLIMPHEAVHETSTDAAEESAGEVLAEAMMGPQIAAAKLAKGHGLGYDDQMPCGNIVCCGVALAALEKGAAAWGRVRDRRLLPAEDCAAVVAEHHHVRELIERRIADLRSRVWW